MVLAPNKVKSITKFKQKPKDLLPIVERRVTCKNDNSLKQVANTLSVEEQKGEFTKGGTRVACN